MGGYRRFWLCGEKKMRRETEVGYKVIDNM
jgi:hypothetical protein